jgi:7,8-dihydropterin-6-yl-methyl-4-(beta-D-ribofuranosyl)aminobenzene 5'-phosphate synthase
MSRQALKAEFGLSILGTSQIGDQTRRVLVDFGYTPGDPDQQPGPARHRSRPVRRGGAEPRPSRSLWRLRGAVRRPAAKDRHLPLYVGGEETFCERVAMIASPPPVMGALDRGELAKAGLRVRIAPDPKSSRTRPSPPASFR